ncbi:MAG: DUF1460 domain-containing protein [Bacteroidales bacterium]|nr:DUF1460 domain-containing protein [Bacteroidales bacterium]
MTKRIIAILIASAVALASAAGLRAQNVAPADIHLPNQEEVNQQIFDKVYSAVKADADRPMPELVVKIARQFLGTQYIWASLETEPEQLQVYLDKTDCILFVELSTCFALTVKGYEIVQAGDGQNFCLRSEPSVRKAEPTYQTLCNNIRNMRYRLGVVDDYTSRIHYTSEWILQNQTNGIVEEFSKEIGEQFDQPFFYMSTHTDTYVQLKNNPDRQARIKSMEEHIAAQTPFFYVSQANLRKPEVISQIHSGDIIAFISPRDGLDLAHVAIACADEKGEMHFIHASYGKKKVVFEAESLADYATNGIRVCRYNPAL